MKLLPIAAFWPLAVVAAHASVLAQSPLERLRAEPDWRARNRIARELVADPGLDVRGLLFEARDPDWDPDAVMFGGGSGWVFSTDYPHRVIRVRGEELPRFTGSGDIDDVAIPRSADELVVPRSPERLALGILALRHAERDDVIHDWMLAAMIGRSPWSEEAHVLGELAARRIDRTAQLLGVDGQFHEFRRLIVDLCGVRAEPMLLAWLDEPGMELGVLHDLERRDWDPGTASRLAACVRDAELATDATYLLRGHVTADAAGAVQDALVTLLGDPDSAVRARAAAAFAIIEPSFAAAPGTVAALAALLGANSRDERGCAAVALARFAIYTELPPTVAGNLFDIACKWTVFTRSVVRDSDAACETLVALGDSALNRPTIGSLGRAVEARLESATGYRDRRRYVLQLGHLGPFGASAEGVAAIADALRDADDDATAYASVRALQRIGPRAAAAFPTLAELIEDDPPESLRPGLVLAAFAVAPSLAAARFADQLEVPAQLPRHLAMGLAVPGQRRAIAELLAHPRAELRIAAAATLHMRPARDDALVPKLAGLCADADPRVRNAAIALARQQRALGANLAEVGAEAMTRIGGEAATSVAADGHLTLLALVCGVVPVEELPRLIAVIEALPRDATQVPDHPGFDAPPPLAQWAFAQAIRALPRCDAAIAFLERWMEGEAWWQPEAAITARISMERR